MSAKRSSAGKAEEASGKLDRPGVAPALVTSYFLRPSVLCAALSIALNTSWVAPKNRSGAWCSNLAWAQQGQEANVNPAPLPEAPPAPTVSSHHRRALLPNEELSSQLTDYLHKHRLPYVDAIVFTRRDGTPTSVLLSGQARTETGRTDAEVKAEDFLGHAHLRIENHIELNAGLGLNSAPPGAAPPRDAAASAPPGTEGGSCSDLCQKDSIHCQNHCSNQVYGNAPNVSGSVVGLISQMGQTAAQNNDCTEDCKQTLDHCVYECNENSGPGVGPPEGGASQPYGGDPGQEPSGPDRPPE
jgi:hypothetical protein